MLESTLPSRSTGLLKSRRSHPALLGLASLVAATAVIDPGTLLLRPLFSFLALVPWILLLSRSLPRARIAPLAVVSAAYLLGYPISHWMGHLTQVGVFAGLAEDVVGTALLWSYRGFALLFAGYAAGLALAPARASLSDQGRERTTTRFVAALGVLGGLAILVQLVVMRGAPLRFLERPGVGFADSTVGMLAHYPVRLNYCFLFLYLSLRLAGLRSRGLDRLFYAVLALQLFFAAGSGAKAELIATILCLLLPALLRVGRFTAKQSAGLLFAAGAAYLTFALVGEYRLLVRRDPPRQGLGMTESLDYQARVLGKAFGQATAAALEQESREVLPGRRPLSAQIISRTGSSLSSFASVLESSREQSPHEHAVESFLIPVWAFVPRTAYPEKPVFFDSGTHASWYGWTAGGISVSLPASFFWAWGYTGVLLGMFGVGVVLGGLTGRASIQERAGPVYSALLILFVLALADTGATFQAIFTDLVRMAAALWLLFWICAAAGQRRRSAHLGLP